MRAEIFSRKEGHFGAVALPFIDEEAPLMSDKGRDPEWVLMLRALLALLYKGASIKPLIDADIAQEKTRNTRFAEFPEKEAQFRREYTPTLIERLRILRRNLMRSFLLLFTATALAFLVLYLRSLPKPGWLGVASVFLLAWSTLCRLGYPARTQRRSHAQTRGFPTCSSAATPARTGCSLPRF
jgi:hypothetical protein